MLVALRAGHREAGQEAIGIIDRDHAVPYDPVGAGVYNACCGPIWRGNPGLDLQPGGKNEPALGGRTPASRPYNPEPAELLCPRLVIQVSPLFQRKQYEVDVGVGSGFSASPGTYEPHRPDVGSLPGP